MWLDRSDAQRTAVIIAAVALAVDDPDERVRWLERIDSVTEGHSRRLSEQALLRAQLGSRLALLD